MDSLEKIAQDCADTFANGMFTGHQPLYQDELRGAFYTLAQSVWANALCNSPDPRVIRWNAIESAKLVAAQAIETADPHEAEGAERQREFTIAKLTELQNEFLGDAPQGDVATGDEVL